MKKMSSQLISLEGGRVQSNGIIYAVAEFANGKIVTDLFVPSFLEDFVKNNDISIIWCVRQSKQNKVFAARTSSGRTRKWGGGQLTGIATFCLVATLVLIFVGLAALSAGEEPGLFIGLPSLALSLLMLIATIGAFVRVISWSTISTKQSFKGITND